MARYSLTVFISVITAVGDLMKKELS